MSWNDFYKTIQDSYHIEDEATVIKISIDEISEITSKSIFYKNGYWSTKEIDLDECMHNFDLAQGISSEQRTDGLKCVGGLCFPFFEFFTAPHHTRVYIPLKETMIKRFLQWVGLDPYSKERAKFHAFQKMLNVLGFTLLDLT